MASGLLIGRQFYPEELYWDGQQYNQELLKQWHGKPLQCGCQYHNTKAEMHVRRTSSQKYTLANNPDQSDKHVMSCKYYSEVEHSRNFKPPMFVVDDKLFVNIQLFSGGGGGSRSSIYEDDDEDERFYYKQKQEAKERKTRAFTDFMFDWYRLAMERIVKDKKKPTRNMVLYYMWQCVYEHKIFVGDQDFYYFSYIPNAKYNRVKSKKVVIGWVVNVEPVIGGQRWTIEGMKGAQIEVLVNERHVPKYPVLTKLAALRVDFNHPQPVVKSRANAWTVTADGWWLHSESEQQLLDALKARGETIIRPLNPSDEHLGYQPDFVLPNRYPHVYLDVLDPPNEDMYDRRYRARQEETLRAASKDGAIVYVPWRSGDLLPF